MKTQALRRVGAAVLFVVIALSALILTVNQRALAEPAGVTRIIPMCRALQYDTASLH